jgi:nucleotide-binding universal stress UspA family protein
MDGQDRQRRIIVGIDDTPSGMAALRWAVDSARNRDAQLVAVRSWELGQPAHGGRHHRHRAGRHVVVYFNGAEQRDASAKLVRDAFQAADGGRPRDLAVVIRTPQADPGEALTGLATGDEDLLVVGHKHVPSWRRARRSSVSRYCCGHARCPVVVVPDGGGRA